MASKSRMVTIPREMGDDLFYRYKRIMITPTIINKNGGTTQISTADISILAKQLGRSDIVIAHYIGKSAAAGMMIIGDKICYRKVMNAAEIDDIVESYIKKSVLCSQCGNPETVEYRESLVCKACGGVTR